MLSKAKQIGDEEMKKCSIFGYIQPGEGEGMYEDGSVISHWVYPYAGGYGQAMVAMAACLLNLLNCQEVAGKIESLQGDALMMQVCEEGTLLR